MLETILSVVGGLIVQDTGEIILYAVTLGRRKPSFQALPKERGTLRGTLAEGILSEVGFWVGLGFYGIMALLLILFLS